MLTHSVRGQGLLEFPPKWFDTQEMHFVYYIHLPSLYSQISAIATDNIAPALTPISGYLSYSDGATVGEITISTVDDLTPEPSTVFSLQLTSSNGGSRIDLTASTATVTGKYTMFYVCKMCQIRN